MFAAGVIDEVKAIGEISETASQAIGFREIRDLLAGRSTKDECLALIQQKTRNYAKRQLTWFRKEASFRVIDLCDEETDAQAIERIETALNFAG
jgi:tRNA dimethylallyltransferase